MTRPPRVTRRRARRGSSPKCTPRRRKLNEMAERVGFEPTSPVLPGYPLSRRALSTAQTPLPKGKFSGGSAFHQSAGARQVLSSRGKERLHGYGAFLG